MKIVDVIRKLEDKFPVDMQLEYDNSGFQLGNIETNLDGVLVCLDVREKVVDEAIDKKCNLIISHHPIFFNPLSQINTSFTNGKTIAKLIKNDICVYSLHTNFDLSNEGLGRHLTKKLNIKFIKPIYQDGIGTIGEISNLKLKVFINNIEKALECKILNYSGDETKTLKKAAFINGSGGRDSKVVEMLVDEGVDVFVTSEIAHNVAIELCDNNISFIEITHYDSEKMFIRQMSDILIKMNINNVKMSEKDISPYNTRR